LRVRICHFGAPGELSGDEARFADDLFFALSNQNAPPVLEKDWPRLKGTAFDDNVGPVDCFDNNKPQVAGISYVTIRGALSQFQGGILSETIFTYLPYDEKKQPLGESFKLVLDKDNNAPRQIVREALKRLDNMLN